MAGVFPVPVAMYFWGIDAASLVFVLRQASLLILQLLTQRSEWQVSSLLALKYHVPLSKSFSHTVC
jgi:hypothetical protein